MARCRFVKPEIVRLPLSDGDWVEVKKRLTVGEELKGIQSTIGEVNAAGWQRPNVEMMSMAEILAYIVDWSLRDFDDKPVEVGLDALKQLDVADFKEIKAAIEGHIEAMAAERAALKNVKATDGETVSERTSLSVA